MFARYGSGAEISAAMPIVHIQGQDDCSNALAIFSGQARGTINAQRSPGAMDGANSLTQPTTSTTTTPLIYPPAETTPQSLTIDVEAPEAHPFLFGSTAYRDLDGFSRSQNQAAATLVSEPTSSRPEVPMPDFSSFQIPAGITPESLQSQEFSTEVLFDPSLNDSFQQFYAENLGTDTWGMDRIEPSQLGSTMTTGTGVDEDWMVFMKENGLFE